MIKVLLFKAGFCQPCKVFTPKAEAECKALGLDYEIVDIEEDEARTQAYGIRNVPYTIVLKDGSMVERGMTSEMIPKLHEYA